MGADEERVDEMEPVLKGEFNRLEMKVYTLEKEHDKEINELKIQQGIQGQHITTLQTTLDRIQSNTSKTMWTVIGGVILMIIGYFFNPPQPKDTEAVTQMITWFM